MKNNQIVISFWNIVLQTDTQSFIWYASPRGWHCLLLESLVVCAIAARKATLVLWCYTPLDKASHSAARATELPRKQPSLKRTHTYIWSLVLHGHYIHVQFNAQSLLVPFFLRRWYEWNLLCCAVYNLSNCAQWSCSRGIKSKLTSPFQDLCPCLVHKPPSEWSLLSRNQPMQIDAQEYLTSPVYQNRQRNVSLLSTTSKSYKTNVFLLSSEEKP